MSFFGKNKNKIIVAVIVAAALFAAFFWGAPDKSEEEENPVKVIGATVQTEEKKPEKEPVAEEKAPPSEEKAEIKAEKNASLPAEAPTPTEAPVGEVSAPPLKIETAAENEKKEGQCTISISCNTAVDKGEVEFLPADGLILPETTVSFTEGESVFDVLCRVTRENKIHMEFVLTPVYNSAYIEGIGNLYEYDLGPLSGWMYRVNGVFPDYGCSGFTLSAGDRIEWVYTCDLGKDVGGDYSADRGEKNE